MPQLSLYLDEETMQKVESAAKSQRLSISKWVAQQIRSRVNAEYPKEYEGLYGSVQDPSFTVPGDLPFSIDAEREGL